MKRRTSKEMDEDMARTLYVRLPYTIKSAKQVEELFVGDIKIKMPRQSARYCHVVFPSVEEKMKNLKNVKKLMVNGKHVIACPPKVNKPEEKKKKEKKIKIPKPKPEPKVTKTLYISNIKPGTKAQDVKLAFPGCISLVMLKSQSGKNRKAILKLGSVQLAGEYLRKEREWPEVKGNRLMIKPDTRKRQKTGKKKTSGLKIYGEDAEIDSKKKSKKTDGGGESSEPQEDESENSEEEEEEEMESAEEEAEAESEAEAEDTEVEEE